MKYCKKCGVLYSTDVCPKCGIFYPDEGETEPSPADAKKVKRHWIGILIGVPLFISFIILVVTLFHKLT